VFLVGALSPLRPARGGDPCRFPVHDS
jgi:hypothetical protein